MEDQAKHVYKTVELGKVINIGTIKQEIDQDQELNRLDDTSGDINPYRELVVNNAEKGIYNPITNGTVINIK